MQVGDYLSPNESYKTLSQGSSHIARLCNRSSYPVVTVVPPKWLADHVAWSYIRHGNQFLNMTKDWNLVEPEIRELYSKSNGKITLGEIEKLMQRKNFRASTRAYRMKLKEWGLLKYKKKETMKKRGEAVDENSARDGDVERCDDSAMADTMTIEINAEIESTPGVSDGSTEEQRWQAVEDLGNVEPPFTGLFHQAPTSISRVSSRIQVTPAAGDVVLDMLAAILESDLDTLDSFIMQHKEHINDPIGMPFDAPSRFSGHPIMNQIVLSQHPDQTLLDVTCGMPSGPSLWVLLSNGAKGSQHPLGPDLALHNAIKNGRTANVMMLARLGRSNVNGVAGVAWKPLLQAVYWNHPDIVRILIRRGAQLEDASPSPHSSGYHTALQLSLERRARDYLQDITRERCNDIIRHLIGVGANIHATPLAGSTATPFAMFIQPWQTVPFWASKLSVVELDALRMFISGDASLTTPFRGCPCGLLGQTFQHQAIWHSTPNVARLVVDSVAAGVGSLNIYGLLHEILDSCTESKRHSADILRDLRVLLPRVTDLNTAGINGLTPLRMCIERCPTEDLVAVLNPLLDAGADPEYEDLDGIQPFVLAARNVQEPVLSEVMHAMVSRMRGRYTRVVGGVARTWNVQHFPINETQTYEQVMSCTGSTSDFRLEMLDMVPEDIRDTFQRAYFSVTSKNFLDNMTRTAKSRILTARDKDKIVRIIRMRRGIDLPDYPFDQELVIALLDPQPMLSMQIEPADTTATSGSTRIISESAQPRSASSSTMDGASDEPTPRATWRFNPNNINTTPTPVIPDRTLSPASTQDDDMVSSTTLIRWRDPEAQAKPGDLDKACASVLRYECATCNNNVLLTKQEQEKHEREHVHPSTCEEDHCTRRFCALKKDGNVSNGCQYRLL